MPTLGRAFQSSATRFGRISRQVFVVTLVAIIGSAIAGVFTSQNIEIVLLSNQINAATAISAILFLLVVIVQIYRIFVAPERIQFASHELAERIRSLAWQYAVSGGSLSQSASASGYLDALFQHQLDEIATEAGQSGVRYHTPGNNREIHVITEWMRETRAQDLNARRILYARERIQNQERWYRQRTKRNDRSRMAAQWTFLGVVTAGFMLSILNALAVLRIDLVAVASAISVGILAWIQFNQFAAHAKTSSSMEYRMVAYRERCLSNEVDWTENRWGVFVGEVEAAIAPERGAWRRTVGEGANDEEPTLGDAGNRGLPPSSSPPSKSAPPAPESVIYTAFYPPVVELNVPESILVYISHDDRETLADVAADADKILAHERGERVSVIAPEPAVLWRGAELTITPSLPGFQFRPNSISVTWEGDIQRHKFEMKGTSALHGSFSSGCILISIGPLVCARIPFAVFVLQVDPRAVELRSISFKRARRFTKVFPSYSRLDVDIVDRVQEVATLFGDDYLQDVLKLRAGEWWRPKIEQLIRDADVFQLFWSQHAAESPNVTEEWKLALGLPSKPKDFVQPIYWTPERYHPVPNELNGLHFSQLDPSRWAAHS